MAWLFTLFTGSFVEQKCLVVVWFKLSFTDCAFVSRLQKLYVFTFNIEMHSAPGVVIMMSFFYMWLSS